MSPSGVELRGRLTADGEAVRDGEVVLFEGEPQLFSSIAATDADGGYSLTLPASRPATLVGRARNGVLGTAQREVDEGDDEVDLEVPGPWHELNLEVRPPAGDAHPERLQAFLDPVRPAEPREFVTQTAPGAERSHFATLELHEPRTRLRAQAGRWRIGASFIVYERPMIAAPDFKNYVAKRASVDGAELPGDLLSGFELTLDSPSTIVLELRELANSEL